MVSTPTEYQLEDFVPYIKFDQDVEGNATSLKWSLVSSSDTSKPLSFNFPVQVKIQQIRTYEGTTGSNVKIKDNDGWKWFEPYTEVSGDVTFDTIDVSKVFRVRFRLMTYMIPEGKDEAEEKRYEWQFINPELTQMNLNTIQRVRTSFDKTGKPDYSTAQLRHMYIGVEENPTPVQYWQFLPENILKMKIPEGSYSLVDETTNKILAMPSNRTLELMPLYDDGVVVGGTYWEVQPYDSETKHWIDFYDNTGALNGKKVTLLYSDGNSAELSIPKYKTVKEQLASIVPCVELVSEDKKLTKVKLRLVVSNDVDTVKKPDYRTDFYARVVDTSGNSVEKFDWKNETSEEIWELDKSYPLDSIQQVYLDVRSYENSEKPVRYRWNFYLSKAKDTEIDPEEETEPTTEPESETKTEDKNVKNVGSSSSGCEIGSGIFGLAILGLTLLRKRSR